jgi:hypothetical protein
LGNDAFKSKAEIANTGSDSSVNIQAVQSVEVKNSGLPQSTKKSKWGPVNLE